MTARERLRIYIDYKGISKYRFYKEAGLSNGFLDKEGNIGSDKCEKIYYLYPDLNLIWLITGEGDMILSSQNVTSISQSINGNNNIATGKGNTKINEGKTYKSSVENYKKQIKQQDMYIKNLLAEIEKLHKQIDKLIDKIK